MERPLLAVDRHHRILERVAVEQSIDYASLAAEFGVSPMTIRRDIKQLVAEGYLRTVRGGATAHLTRSFDLVLGKRALTHALEKRLIGRRAVALIEPGETIFLGIGSTVAQFAQFLPANLGVTVVTRIPGPREPARLAQRPGGLHRAVWSPARSCPRPAPWRSEGSTGSTRPRPCSAPRASPAGRGDRPRSGPCRSQRPR